MLGHIPVKNHYCSLLSSLEKIEIVAKNDFIEGTYKILDDDIVYIISNIVFLALCMTKGHIIIKYLFLHYPNP